MLLHALQKDNLRVNYTYNQLNDLLTKVQQGDAAVEYVYNAKRYLSEIKHNGFSYTMGYDQFGNRVNTKVGNRVLTLNEFAGGNGKLTKSTYGNGAYVSYGYDALGRVVSRSYNGAEAFRYLYANDGKLGKLVDRVNGVQTMFNYDTIGRLSSWWDSQGNRGGYAYDLNNNLTNWNYLVFGKKIAQEYTYGVDDVLQKSVLPGYTAEYTYDSLLRLKEKSLPGNKTISYTYHDGANGSTTTLLKKLSGAGLLDVEYAYDALGNITSIKENGVVQVSYEYDAYNQLVKETYAGGDVIGYSYDNGGNLLSKTVNGVVSNSYAYGDTEWKDLLTGFNGTTITYDEIGNPQNWRDGMSFTWVNGRQLSALQKGDLNVSYSYNSDGLRVSKTVNGVKTEYVWDGSSLIGQKTGNNVLVYLYAADGLAGFQYNGVNYYYLKNGQGDVVAILDASGNIVAKYAYDAWGKLLNVTDATGADKSADSAFIGNINPVRYRSYYYDTETGLYYLQSRYYDPEVGRFINADGILGANGSILAYNLFAYCGNNPIRRSDPNGCFFIADDVLGGIIIAIVVLFAASEIIVYSQSAPTWGNNALKLPDSPDFDLDSDNQKKSIPFPFSPSFTDITPSITPAPDSKSDDKPGDMGIIWIAKYVQGKGVQVLNPVTYEQALSSLLSGSSQSFMCIDGDVAKMLTNSFRRTRIYEIDKGKEGIPGYYYHYHLNNKHGNPHIWHYGEKLHNWR